jgi:hypothetical protein
LQQLGIELEVRVRPEKILNLYLTFNLSANPNPNSNRNTHEQDFLNSVCQEIIHLDDKKLIVYKGNYDNFKEQEAVKAKQQQKAWEKQERKLKGSERNLTLTLILILIQTSI